MELKFSKKMDNFQPSIFNVLEEKKQELLKAGKEVYNLSVGTPDYEPDKHVMDALVEAAKYPENYKYSLGDIPELVDAVKKWYDSRYDVKLESNEIMSVYGSQEGLARICLTLCDPGDIVLVPNPGYPIFEIGPFLCGAKVEYYNLHQANNYVPDLDSIPEELAKKAKVMMVSYPLNPVCTIAPDEFYEELIQFAKKYNIMIIHDNAYSELVYDGERGKSFLSFEGAKEVGVEFNSLSKTYNLTGARISFVLGNSEIINKFKTLRSQIDYGIFIPVQKAAVAALTGSQESVRIHRETYQRRRDALCGGLRRIGWDVPNCQGTMFAWAPIPKGFNNSVEFVLELLDKTGVICVPGSSFGSLGEGYVRFALVLPEEKMEELVEVIDKSGIIKK